VERLWPAPRDDQACDNVLYELNGERALDLYERYLGPADSQGLPGSALLYPLRISDPDNPTQEVVRNRAWRRPARRLDDLRRQHAGRGGARN